MSQKKTHVQQLASIKRLQITFSHKTIDAWNIFSITTNPIIIISYSAYAGKNMHNSKWLNNQNHRPTNQPLKIKPNKQPLVDRHVMGQIYCTSRLFLNLPF